MINIRDEKEVQIWCDYQEETRQTSADYFLRLRFCNFRTFQIDAINHKGIHSHAKLDGDGDGDGYGDRCGNGYGCGDYGDYGNSCGDGNSYGYGMSSNGYLNGDGYHHD